MTTENEVLEELSSEPIKFSITLDNAEPQNQLGLAACRKENYLQAIKFFREAIKCNQKNRDYHNNLLNAYGKQAILYSNSQQFDQAIDCYTRLINNNHKILDAYYQRSFAYYQQKEFDKALADLNQLLALNPNYPNALQAQSLVIKQKGNLSSTAQIKKIIKINDNGCSIEEIRFNQQAVKNINQIKLQITNNLAENKQQDIIQTYNNDGLAHFNKKQYNEAKLSFRNALADNINPKHERQNAIFYHNLGAIAYLEKNYLKAAKFFTKAFNFDKEIAITRKHLIKTYHAIAKLANKTRDSKKAIDYCDKIIALDPHHKEAYYERGYAYHDQKNYDQAIKDIEKVLILDNEHIKAYNELGFIFENQANLNIKEEDRKKLLKRSTKNFHKIITIASQCVKANTQSNQTAANNNDILSNYYNDIADAYHCLARIHTKIQKIAASATDTQANKKHPDKNFTQAKKHYKKAIKFNPNNTEAYQSLGRLYYNNNTDPDTQEEQELLLTCYEKIIQDQQQNSLIHIYNNIGFLYSELGKIDRAIEYFLKTINEIKDNGALSNACYYLGKAFAEKNNHEKAKEYFKQTIQHNPNNKEAHISLGEYYVNDSVIPNTKEEKYLILKCYEFMINDPEQKDELLCRTYYQISLLHSALGNSEQENEALVTAKQLTLKCYEKVINALTNKLKENSQDFNAAKECGTILGNLNKSKERFDYQEKKQIIQILEKCITINPKLENALFCNTIGNFYFARQEYGEAITAFMRTLKICPQNKVAIKGCSDACDALKHKQNKNLRNPNRTTINPPRIFHRSSNSTVTLENQKTPKNQYIK